jgi:hypothetical protein
MSEVSSGGGSGADIVGAAVTILINSGISGAMGFGLFTVGRGLWRSK